MPRLPGLPGFEIWAVVCRFCYSLVELCWTKKQRVLGEPACELHQMCFPVLLTCWLSLRHVLFVGQGNAGGVVSHFGVRHLVCTSVASMIFYVFLNPSEGVPAQALPVVQVVKEPKLQPQSIINRLALIGQTVNNSNIFSDVLLPFFSPYFSDMSSQESKEI